MKLFAIVAFLALPGVNAVYFACCKRENSCPAGRNSTNVKGDSFKVCCVDGENADGAELDDIPTCLEDIATEGGASISVMALPVPEVATTAEAKPTAEVTITSANACCGAIAAVQPGRVRSSPAKNPRGSVCPENTFSIDGAMYMEGKTKYQVCCDGTDGRQPGEFSDAPGLSACEGTTIETPTHSNDTVDLAESSDTAPTEPIDESVGKEEPTVAESNSANAVESAAMAAFGAALQAAL